LQSILKIVIGAILLALGAIGLFAGYSGDHIIASIFSWVALLIGAGLLTFGIADYRRGQRKPKSVQYTELEERLLIQSMACVANADGKLRDIEVTAIANIHEQLLQDAIDRQEIHTLLEGLNYASVLENLENHSGSISEHMKRIIVQSCHLIMISDSEIMKTEENRIHEIGTALGLTPDAVDDGIAMVSI